MSRMPRPDMRDYFRAHIDRHVNGMLSTRRATLPANVRTVTGTVTDKEIVVTMVDGTVYRWTGGRYATRKVRGCYAPLMPVAATDSAQQEGGQSTT